MSWLCFILQPGGDRSLYKRNKCSSGVDDSKPTLLVATSFLAAIKNRLATMGKLCSLWVLHAPSLPLLFIIIMHSWLDSAFKTYSSMTRKTLLDEHALGTCVKHIIAARLSEVESANHKAASQKLSHLEKIHHWCHFVSYWWIRTLSIRYKISRVPLVTLEIHLSMMVLSTNGIVGPS